MITQGSYKIDTTSTSTSTWVASQAQQTITIPSPSQHSQTLPSPAQPTSARSTDTTGSRPLIKPIRGFKPSNRKSTEMALRRTSTNDDNTLRALEGYEPKRRISDPIDPDEPNSDESDMFLRAAREEMPRQASNGPVETISRSESRRSRIGQRSSVPPNTSYSSPISRRRGSDQESNVSRPMEEQGNVGQVLTYRPAEKDRAPSALDDINKSRFYAANTRSNPTTPRGPGNREISPEALPYNGRRGSLPDPTSVLPQRSSYRQSNLSYSTPRNYNSSPLVSRSIEVHDAPIPETPRAAEGTESSVSTTAPSTVWDELEDLKSRIHRLELTGKLPATSGAAISRASNDRPPTATTTVTTMSTSPRQRGRGNSVSPIEAEQPNEVHPLLHAAIAKSKPLLSAEIYKALEATASDALTIASMMGTSGQPGPISSSQSTVGGPGVSDRQVRRKADSMCRSLTELCLALSDEANERGQSIAKETANRPQSRDTELHTSTEQSPLPRQPISTDLARVKASPRALSRLEARRSSLLNTSTLPSPRYAPSEAGTPTQASMAGRRTSLFLRSRRGNTEEPEEEDDTRFRAPSRATTEIGRFRNSQKEYVSQEPMPERTLTIQSSLPVRRHVASSSFPSTVAAPVAPSSNLSGRKYLDRSTPERDSNTVVGRLMEDRGQRKSSIGGGFGLGRTGSLTRRSRQPSTAETSSAGQGSYQ
ncbi:hypothetical protein B0J14DRAFT_469896 [Halenospora varia]|nr:hypothetical protein B0J14DRAFT_469896 [Halenospora varia]